MYCFPILEPVRSSMSSSNCCFLTCIQGSQEEAGKVVQYSHLFTNFPQFVMIHTVKGFGIVNETEIGRPIEGSIKSESWTNTLDEQRRSQAPSLRQPPAIRVGWGVSKLSFKSIGLAGSHSGCFHDLVARGQKWQRKEVVSVQMPRL